MPCLLALFALLVPRVVLVGLFLFTNYLEPAFRTRLWPVLGFIFMPLTTLAYAYAIRASGSVEGGYLILVIVAATIDLGLWGHSSWHGRRYRMARRSD